MKTTVGGAATFEGNNATRYTSKTNGTNTVGGITDVIDTLGDYYVAQAPGISTTVFGAVVTANQVVFGFSVAVTLKSVYTPPFVDRRYGLSVGQSITQTQTQVATTTTGGILGTPPTVTSTTQTASTTSKFVAIENITVPAGTYRACRFEESASATPTSISTSWVIFGRGLLVRSEAPGASGTQVIQATSVKVNGAAI